MTDILRGFDCAAFRAGYVDAIFFSEGGPVCFWLNRNGHGSGFWDEDTLREPEREALDKLAESYHECYATINDEGEVGLD